MCLLHCIFVVLAAIALPVEVYERRHMMQMTCKKRTTAAAGLILAGLGLVCAPAAADVIAIESDTSASTEGLGAYSGWMQYTAGIFDGTGTLTISLTNTSDADNGGYITGLAFNIDSDDANATAVLSSTDYSGFSNIEDANAAPFGTYDAGAALGGNWLGGGSPHGGIAVGESGLFEFMVEAIDASSLLTENFLASSGQHPFVVRFRGFEDDGSDKVPGIPSTTVVPAPAAALGLFALAGLAGHRRRR
jgi:MYXO-CTERM domain-containing protein